AFPADKAREAISAVTGLRKNAAEIAGLAPGLPAPSIGELTLTAPVGWTDILAAPKKTGSFGLATFRSRFVTALLYLPLRASQPAKQAAKHILKLLKQPCLASSVASPCATIGASHILEYMVQPLAA